MAQIKIEITYDPSMETLDQAVCSLVPTADSRNIPNTISRAEVELETKSEHEPTSTSAGPEAKPQEMSTAATVGKPQAEDKAKPTKTDVRAIATALSKSGKREELSAIFAEFGGKKLSDIKEEDYPALMERLVAANG